MENFKYSISAVINFKGHQYQIHTGSIITIDNINIKKNNLFFINNILLLKYKDKYYFNDNFYLKRIIILARVISDKIYKNNYVLNMKRRKHHLKKKNIKSYYVQILIENFILNYNL